MTRLPVNGIRLGDGGKRRRGSELTMLAYACLFRSLLLASAVCRLSWERRHYHASSQPFPCLMLLPHLPRRQLADCQRVLVVQRLPETWNYVGTLGQAEGASPAGTSFLLPFTIIIQPQSAACNLLSNTTSTEASAAAATADAVSEQPKIISVISF